MTYGIRGRARNLVIGCAVAVVVALVAFVPPWFSGRLTDRGQYRWAKRLDPLSVDPYVRQGTVAALKAQVADCEGQIASLSRDRALHAVA